MTINDVLTFTEAAQRWGLDTSTLRKLVHSNRLTNGVDYRKSGGTWLITRAAMEKVYKERPLSCGDVF